MKGLYAYIRVSTPKQGERGSSLQQQRAAIDAYAQRHGLAVIEWFEEMETAAKRGRRGFTRMLQQLKRGKADGVIIHKIDRGARNLRDWADLGELIDQGIQVHFANETLDLNTRGGRLSADIQAVVAADYIRNLREEVRKGFYGRLKQGIYPLPAPIGYRDEGAGNPKSFNPITAPLVKRAFQLYATGRHNFFTLGDELFRLGLRNKRGGRVSKTGISVMLNNQFYIGLIHIKRTGETFQGKHPPLISKSTFDRVQQLLSGKIRNQGLRHEFLYRRKLRCIHCRYALIAEVQKGHTYYRCHTSTCPRTCLREEEVERFVQDTLEKVRLSQREEELMVVDLVARLESASKEEKDLMVGIRLNLDQLDARLGRLTDAYIDRIVDKEMFEERKNGLLHERASLNDRLDDLASGTVSLQSKVANFLELIRDLSTNENSVTREEKCDLALKVTSNLGVNAKYLDIAWRPLFAPIAFRFSDTSSPPQRDTPRTFEPEVPYSSTPKTAESDTALHWHDAVWEELKRGVTGEEELKT